MPAPSCLGTVLVCGEALGAVLGSGSPDWCSDLLAAVLSGSDVVREGWGAEGQILFQEAFAEEVTINR